MLRWADQATRRALLGAVVNAMTMSELAQVRHMLDRNSIRRRLCQRVG